MAHQHRDIELTHLLLNPLNPRLRDGIEGQHDAIKELVAEQGKKILVLAKHIVEHGQDPSTIPVVVPDDDEAHYIVVEGNRRITALKLLHSEELAAAVLPEKLRTKFVSLRGQAADLPDTVFCAVLPDEEAADIWVRLRHQGEAEGAGVVAWSGIASERHRARSGDEGLGHKVTEFLKAQGALSERATSSLQSAFPITTLNRILNTPGVRSTLGLQLDKGELYTSHTAKEVARALTWIVEDLAAGKSVSDLKNRDLREKYVRDEVPKKLLPDPASAGPTPRRLDQLPTAGQPSSAPDGRKPGGKRPVQPKDPEGPVAATRDGLHIENERANLIFHELKDLRAKKFPNAIAVLLRLFLEITLHELGRRHPEAKAPRGSSGTAPTLTQRLKAAEAWLSKNDHLPRSELVGVRRAADKNHFIAGGLNSLHDWVHSSHTLPTGKELHAAWNSWLPFFRHVWK